MDHRTLTRLSGASLVASALIAAAATALELVTSPYNPGATLYAIDAPVHLAKYIAMLALLVTLPVAYVGQRLSAGRLGLTGLVLCLVGLGLAGTPYNIMELTLDPAAPVADAAASWEQIMTTAQLLGAAGAIGFLAVLIGIAAFAIASRRGGGGWRVAASVSLGSLVFAVVQMFLFDGVPIPHGPTWLLVGLAGYGVAAWRSVADTTERAGARTTAAAQAG